MQFFDFFASSDFNSQKQTHPGVGFPTLLSFTGSVKLQIIQL